MPGFIEKIKRFYRNIRKREIVHNSYSEEDFSVLEAFNPDLICSLEYWVFEECGVNSAYRYKTIADRFGTEPARRNPRYREADTNQEPLPEDAIQTS